ncbi:hypothetical protein D3C85_1284220 [compost metagenome]
MVPLPCFTRLPVPEITPDTVVVVLSPPALRVNAPSWMLAPALLLNRLPTVWSDCRVMMLLPLARNWLLLETEASPFSFSQPKFMAMVLPV